MPQFYDNNEHYYDDDQRYCDDRYYNNERHDDRDWIPRTRTDMPQRPDNFYYNDNNSNFYYNEQQARLPPARPRQNYYAGSAPTVVPRSYSDAVRDGYGPRQQRRDGGQGYGQRPAPPPTWRNRGSGKKRKGKRKQLPPRFQNPPPGLQNQPPPDSRSRFSQVRDDDPRPGTSNTRWGNQDQRPLLPHQVPLSEDPDFRLKILKLT